MANERRYGDDEVEEILDYASRGGGAVRGSGSVDEHGLTLAELQEVGREVGLDPARIAEGASALDRRGAAVPARTMLGRPLSIGRTVELPRAPTDHEWEQLVAELRETFAVKGKVSSSGGLREWSIGNLHALVEPTPTGHRLRLRTLKGSALAVRAFGTFGLGFAALVGAIMTAQGRWDDLVIPIVFAVAGAAALLSPLLTLRPWARQREDQMEHIARWVADLLEA